MRTMCAALVLVTALAAPASSRLNAKEQGHGADKTVVGSWFVTVTPSVMPAFVGLITSSADGGLIETNALTLASSLESPGHGQWIRIKPGRYAMTFVNLEVNPDGSFAGTGKVRSTVTLDPSGNELSGTFQVDIFDPNGVLLFSDSGTVSATRIEVEP
jgi:hypothetical protein